MVMAIPLIVGIDPGINGALAFLSHAGQVISYSKMPKLASREQDIPGLFKLLRDVRADLTMVLIERVTATAIGGKKQNFSFGRNLGQVEGVMVAMGLPFLEVHPKTWQKVMHDGASKSMGPKERSLLVAKRLWPSCDFGGEHDGIIDASLIAEYGRRIYHQTASIKTENQVPAM